MKRFDTSLAHVWHATQSQVYTELGKLANAGLLTAADDGPHRRKEYTLTEDGRAELRRWLATPAEASPVRSETLLRVFFLGELPTEQATAFLAAVSAAAATEHQRLREVERSVDWSDGELAVHGRLALELGLRMAEARRAWALWAAERLARGDG